MTSSRFASRLLSAALLVGWAAGAAHGAEESLAKAELILDQYIEATGGKAAYEKLHNLIIAGTMELAGKGLKGTLTTYKAEPSLSYTVWETEALGKVEDGTDGQIAWHRNTLQGPRLKEGEEKAAVLREATFHASLRWRDLYKKAETTGAETVDGHACYKVVMTPLEGRPQTRYYDKKTHLLVKVAATVKTPMGEIPTEATFDDYRVEGGILAPHKVEQKSLGQQILITFDSIKYNTDIPKERFEPPEDVKALLQKTKADKN